MYRTHKLNELRLENVNESVTLSGWVSKVRDLGHFIFIDLRDRSGKVQLVINPDNNCYEEASKVRNEYVLKVNRF